jgi:haloalkane dehalogenase
MVLGHELARLPSTTGTKRKAIMTNSQGAALPNFTEHRVQHAGGNLCVRDFPGSGPAFVLLHGFPDNSHIYDRLIPHLAGGGRRTVAFDFLGFGASDKPEGAHYSFEQQVGDVEAVVDALGLEKIVPVGHDAGGPAAINFALRNPTRAAGICLMNAFYDASPGLHVPEFIELFATKSLKALTRHTLATQFAWLLDFQRGQWRANMTESQKTNYNEFIVPIVDRNFTQQPSAGPAFAQMTYQLFDEVAANTARRPDLRRTNLPLLLIWGNADTYLHVSVAEYLKSQARNATLHALDAGHWPQIDEPAEIARIMLANQWS